MTKILHVIGGMNRAGAETMLMNIYRSIDRSKFQFDFLVYGYQKQDYEEEIKSYGGRIIRIPQIKGYAMIFSINTIRKILQTEGPYTSIHAHTLCNSVYAIIAAYLEGNINIICHSHSTQNSTKKSILKKLYETIAKCLIRTLSHTWLACSHAAGVYLFGKKFKEKGIIINNGILLNAFNESYKDEVKELKKSYHLTSELIIGSIARFEPVKNHQFMLQIAYELKRSKQPFKILLVGTGSLEQEIRDKVAEMNLVNDVLFLGKRSDIPHLLHLFDVLLMPSLFEGAPVTLMEAQGAALPCVISSTIPNDVDLDIGLIKKCSLSEETSSWCHHLITHNRNYITISHNDIQKAFINKGADISQTVNQLTRLYEKR